MQTKSTCLGVGMAAESALVMPWRQMAMEGDDRMVEAKRGVAENAEGEGRVIGSGSGWGVVVAFGHERPDSSP